MIQTREEDTSRNHYEFLSKKKRGVEEDEYSQIDPLDDTWADSFSNESPYEPGVKIMHPKFGTGTIQKCEGRPDNLKLTVQFQKSGIKKILLNYCSIEVVPH